MTPEQYEKAGSILTEVKRAKHDIDLMKRPGHQVCAYTCDGIRLGIPDDVRKSIEILALQGLERRLIELEKEFTDL